MEVKADFDGHFFTIYDTKKFCGIMITRSTVRELLESEQQLSARLFKMIQRVSDEEIMKELAENVVLRVGLYKEQIRVDLRETTIKDGDVTFLKSGVNLSVMHFLHLMRMIRKEYEKTKPCLSMTHTDEAEEEEESSSPPPTKKAKVQQVPSKTHHAKDGKAARSFKKGVKALKKKSTIVSSGEEGND